MYSVAVAAVNITNIFWLVPLKLYRNPPVEILSASEEECADALRLESIFPANF